jgi:hypothetical protein
MKKFQVKFTAKNLTGNAGLVHLGKFANKLQLPQTLKKVISIERGHTANYEVANVVMMLMMGVLAGIKHISHLAILRHDSVIRKLFNWEKFPDNRTFGRIFELFNQKHCNELHEVETVAREKVWEKKWFGRVTFDLDSTVIGVNGSQEGAKKGFNPNKKGQKSYHPLLCFLAETKECLHSWFRTGSAYTGNGAPEFIRECFSRLPKRVWKVFVRADSGFFDGNLLDVLEEKKSEYLIKVKMKNLTSLLMSQKWQIVRGKKGIESCEFSYKCRGWKKERRFVALRKEVDLATETRTLFPLPQYEFFCYVTNLKLSPWKIHKCYGKRSTSENWIEWCKNHLASGTIRTQDFWANSALFQTSILAYNLMVWMMWLNTKTSFREEPNTIRAWLIQVPAKLISRARTLILTLSEDYVFKERWMEIENSISSLNFA